jgi:ParB-like chromosome segregation protein Spo0J
VESPSVVRVPINLLVVDRSPRLDGEDAGHVELLAESISALPPIIVHCATMRVIDGVHRLRAAQLRGNTTIDVVFFDGDENEAYVLSVKQNTMHGRPLTRADRKSAAQRIVAIHPEWSDRAIAKVTGLSPKTVASLRLHPIERSAARVGLDGRVRPVDHRSGYRRAGQYLAGHPEATADDLAQASGLSRRSARRVRRRFTDGQDKRSAPQHVQRPPGDDTGQQSVQERDVRLAGAGEVLRTLRTDPSLRFTDGGRALLQLLSASVPWDQNPDQMIDNLPPHCIQASAEAMHTCARTFQTIAEKLEAHQCDVATDRQPDDRRRDDHQHDGD